MKKLLMVLIIFSLFFTCISASFADTSVLMTSKELSKYIDHVNTIGFRILNSNSIERRMVFRVAYRDNSVDAYSSFANRRIFINRGLYLALQSDDEIAGVLSYNIANLYDSYDGILRGFFSQLSHSVTPKKYTYKSDKKAVDYMVKAGYNPIAYIVVMSKLYPQERFDWYSVHPLTSRRMMEVYEYIYKKYPEYLVDNKYKNDIYYQNFLLTSKRNREKFQQKVRMKSSQKVKYL